MPVTKLDLSTIEINGEKYVRLSDIPVATPPLPTGTRHVIVVDRGWIFAGDVTRVDGRIYLDRAVMVFRWERIGFPAVIANSKQPGVDIRPMSTRVDLPADAEIFALPVHDTWGL